MGRPSSVGGIAVGAATTARFGSDKDADITVADSGRTAQIANNQAGGVRTDTSFNGATAKLYGEAIVTTQTTEASSNFWRIMFANSSVSLANGSGGIYARATDTYINPSHYLLTSGGVNGGPTSIDGNYLGPLTDGDIIQWQVAYGYLFIGREGALSGLTDAQAQAGVGACASGLTGTLYLMFYLDGTGTVDPSLSIAATTSFAAPAISGNSVY